MSRGYNQRFSERQYNSDEDYNSKKNEDDSSDENGDNVSEISQFTQNKMRNDLKSLCG